MDNWKYVSINNNTFSSANCICLYRSNNILYLSMPSAEASEYELTKWDEHDMTEYDDHDGSDNP